MNTIKFSVLACMLLISGKNIQAQAPCWFTQPPTSRNSNFVYAVGMSANRDVGKIRNLAEAEALRRYVTDYQPNL
jgi:hypothetical protein